MNEVLTEGDEALVGGLIRVGSFDVEHDVTSELCGIPSVLTGERCKQDRFECEEHRESAARQRALRDGEDDGFPSLT